MWSEGEGQNSERLSFSLEFREKKLSLFLEFFEFDGGIYKSGFFFVRFRKNSTMKNSRKKLSQILPKNSTYCRFFFNRKSHKNTSLYEKTGVFWCSHQCILVQQKFNDPCLFSLFQLIIFLSLKVTGDQVLFGHGGRTFWALSSAFFALVYAAVLVMPLLPCRHSGKLKIFLHLK